MSIKDELIRLLDNSYAPYSNYHVASIVVMNDGNYFKGVNVENSSYGATVCAERNAIFAAITDGYTKGDFKKIYVMTDGDTIAPSCFLCRQVMVEFFDKDAEVVFSNKQGDARKYTVEELCPVPFTNEDM